MFFNELPFSCLFILDLDKEIDVSAHVFVFKMLLLLEQFSQVNQ